MTLPDPFLSDTFADNEVVNEVNLFGRLLTRVNQVIAWGQTVVNMIVLGDAWAGVLTDQVKIQAGEQLLTTNSVGVCNLTFPEPFPTGVAAVLMTLNDTSGGWDAKAIQTALTYAVVHVHLPNGDPYLAGTVRIGYIAIGT